MINYMYEPECASIQYLLTYQWTLSELHFRRFSHHQHHSTSLSCHLPTWWARQPQTCKAPSTLCHTFRPWNSGDGGIWSCSRTWEGCRQECYSLKLWCYPFWRHRIDREVGSWWWQSRVSLVKGVHFEMLESQARVPHLCLYSAHTRLAYRINKTAGESFHGFVLVLLYYIDKINNTYIIIKHVIIRTMYHTVSTSFP